MKKRVHKIVKIRTLFVILCGKSLLMYGDFGWRRVTCKNCLKKKPRRAGGEQNCEN